MPTKRKFSAKFPTARIKKIIQLDDEIGKLAATVPPVVSRALELFIEQLITKSYQVTVSRNSKTILPSCVKEIIENETGFAFLKPLVSNVPSLKSLAESAESKTKSRLSSESKPAKKRENNSSRQNGNCSSKPCKKNSKDILSLSASKQNKTDDFGYVEDEEEIHTLRIVEDSFASSTSNRTGRKRKYAPQKCMPYD